MSHCSTCPLGEWAGFACVYQAGVCGVCVVCVGAGVRVWACVSVGGWLWVCKVADCVGGRPAVSPGAGAAWASGCAGVGSCRRPGLGGRGQVLAGVPGARGSEEFLFWRLCSLAGCSGDASWDAPGIGFL